jgi:hypothetical protein
MSDIETIGAIVSVLVAIIVAVLTKDKNRKIDWGTTTAWLLIGLLITSHLNQRDIINKNAELLNLYGEFRSSPSTIEVARNEIEAKKSLLEVDINFFQNIFSQKNDRYKENLTNLRANKISYNTNNLSELGEMYSDVIRIFELSDNETSIRATSYVNVEQWWTNEFGEEYKNVNKSAVEKGTQLTRVWIFETSRDFENSKQQMEYQKEVLGVETFYVYEKDIQNLNESKIDVILVDNPNQKSYYGELELTPLRKMISVSFGSDSQRMRELNLYWNQLIEVSKRY